MKRKILFSILLFSASLTGFCTIWTVTSAGTTFTPDVITITDGDTVNFVIGGEHNAKEVSLTTWNANGNTDLPGGFQIAFGGGMVLPAQLGVGTHYYVCAPHAFLGMKGTIIVQESITSTTEIQTISDFSLYPNPSTGRFQFTIDNSQIAKNCKLEVYNVQGERIYQSAITNPKSEIEMSNQASGIYFVKIYNGQAILTKKIVIQ